jgi:hypothetical protein
LAANASAIADGSSGGATPGGRRLLARARTDGLRILVLAVLLALAGPNRALAHGDPASHYLEAELLYPAFANRPSQALELRLLGLLQAAERRGYPIKVALVAAEGDLTEEPELLRRPQKYADFVSGELGAGVRAPVLIVTPFGFGVSGRELRGGRLQPVSRDDAGALMRGVEPPRHAQGDGLARAAIAAVRRIARAADRPLPAHVPPAPVLGSGERKVDSGTGRTTDLRLIAMLFVATFLLLWASFELWLRRPGRRGDGPARSVPGP